MAGVGVDDLANLGDARLELGDIGVDPEHEGRAARARRPWRVVFEIQALDRRDFQFGLAPLP